MGGSNLITFTVDGTEYQAEEGMTWEDWVNSEYSGNDFVIKNGGVHINSGKVVNDDGTTHAIYRNIQIINGGVYYAVVGEPE